METRKSEYDCLPVAERDRLKRALAPAKQAKTSEMLTRDPIPVLTTTRKNAQR